MGALRRAVPPQRPAAPASALLLPGLPREGNSSRAAQAGGAARETRGMSRPRYLTTREAAAELRFASPEGFVKAARRMGIV